MATPAYDAIPPAATDAAAAREPIGWADRIRRLVLDFRLVVHDHLQLAALEAQRASQALVRTIAAAIAMAVLLATAWLGILVALVVWLAESIPLPGALLIGAAACVALAGGIAWWVTRHLPDLTFSATLRQLRATAQADDETDPEDEPKK